MKEMNGSCFVWLCTDHKSCRQLIMFSLATGNFSELFSNWFHTTRANEEIFCSATRNRWATEKFSCECRKPWITKQCNISKVMTDNLPHWFAQRCGTFSKKWHVISVYFACKSTILHAFYVCKCCNPFGQYCTISQCIIIILPVASQVICPISAAGLERLSV